MRIEPQIIKNRSLVLCGGSYDERSVIIDAASAIFLKELKGKVVIFAENFKNGNEYVRNAKSEFPKVPAPKGVKKNEVTYDEWHNNHLNWISEFKNVLIVIPQLQKLFENDPDYFYELLGFYLEKQSSVSGRNRFRFIMSFSDPISLEAERIPTRVGAKPTLFERNLALVNLPRSE